ncbi:fimbrial biogenesis chaperone [Shimia aestuarii]|uniref:fimbrial biogenesis chaperone n=1 Tax=Shimia aestuarii TaxID=254406 RepID=UPI001FB53F0A|nr:fimbria/pilus periplasmic chaperone [Shimia aestuarii]
MIFGMGSRTRQRSVFAAALLVCLCPVALSAESVSVSPTRLMLPPGAKQAALTVSAKQLERRASVQVRVMSWKYGTPADRLSKTRDVVASPPITKLKPRQELTVRVVRVAKKPVRGRECYRVLVDTLHPKAEDQLVNLRVRHSVPLCFTGK